MNKTLMFWKRICNSVYIGLLVLLAGMPLSSMAAAVELTTAERAWLAGHPRLRMGIHAASPPFDFLTEDGKHKGIITDYLKIISDRLGINFEPVYGLSWIEVLEKAKQKEIDVISLLTKREPRSQYLLFSKPFIKNNMTLVTRDDSPFITGLEDLSGKRVSLIRNYASTGNILERYPKLVPHLVETPLDLIKAVATGQVEAAAIHVPIAAYLIRKHYIGHLKFAAPINVEQPPLGIGVRKDWPELVGILNKALDSISEEERLAIRQKWIALKYEEKVDYALIWKIIAGFSALLLLVLLWNWQTRRQKSALLQAKQALEVSEEALQKSEQLHRHLFENVGVGIVHNDQAGKFLQANESFCRFIGYSEDELRQMTPFDITHPDDLPESKEKFTKKSAGKLDTFNLEKRYLCKDGTVRWGQVNASMARDQNGVVIASMAAVTDISERKLAEQALHKAHDELEERVQERTAELAIVNEELQGKIEERKQVEEILRESEARFRSIFESDMIGTIFWDANGEITDANNAFLEIVGHSHEDILSGRLKWKELTPPEHAERDNEALKELRENGVLTPYEKEYIHKCGDKIPVLVGAATFSGATASGVAFVLDITERKQTEEALKESEQKYRSVVENIGIGVSLISPDMEILALNRQMKEWFPDVDETNRPICYSVFNDPPRKSECSYCPTIKTLVDGEVYESITETPVGDKMLNYRIISSPIKDETGKVVAAIELVEDITERKRAEENERQRLLELAHLSRLNTMGEMMAQIAHELNQPLTAIASTSDAVSQLMASGSQDDRDVHEALKDISSQAQRAGEIIRHLRRLARKESIQKSRFDINGVIQEMLCLIDIEARKYGITVVQELTTVSLEYDGAQILIEQVILNLVRNAIESMSNQRCGARELRIITQKNDSGEIEVVVANTGPGLSPLALIWIFEAFYTTKKSGIGMGLPICRSIIEVHGGKIWATSEPNKGSKLIFTLPAHESMEHKHAE